MRGAINAKRRNATTRFPHTALGTLRIYYVVWWGPVLPCREMDTEIYMGSLKCTFSPSLGGLIIVEHNVSAGLFAEECG